MKQQEKIQKTRSLLARMKFKNGYSWRVENGNSLTGTVMVFLDMITTDSSRQGDVGRTPVNARPDQVYTVTFWLDFDPDVPEEDFYERIVKFLAFTQIHEAQEWFRVDGKIFRDPHLVGPIIDVPPLFQQKFREDV